MMHNPQQCPSCRHYRPDDPGFCCEAFPWPELIPQEIIDDEFDHRQPFPGDQGIHWEPKEPGQKHPFDEDQE